MHEFFYLDDIFLKALKDSFRFFIFSLDVIEIGPPCTKLTSGPRWPASYVNKMM